jgi:hypothetical protein
MMNLKDTEEVIAHLHRSNHFDVYAKSGTAAA